MLPPEELFPLYTEIALALAGFGGVVSAFAGRDRVFQPTERVRFLAVVAASAIVLVGCFSFFVATSAGLAVERALALCALAPLALLLVTLVTIFPAAVRNARLPDSTTETWSLWVSLVVFSTNAALLATAIFSAWSYPCVVAAFSLQLLHGLWMFVRVLTRAN